MVAISVSAPLGCRTFEGLLGHSEIDALAEGLYGVKSWAARLSRWRRRSMDNSDP